MNTYPYRSGDVEELARSRDQAAARARELSAELWAANLLLKAAQEERDAAREEVALLRRERDVFARDLSAVARHAADERRNHRALWRGTAWGAAVLVGTVIVGLSLRTLFPTNTLQPLPTTTRATP